MSLHFLESVSVAIYLSRRKLVQSNIAQNLKLRNNVHIETQHHLSSDGLFCPITTYYTHKNLSENVITRHKHNSNADMKQDVFSVFNNANFLENN